ncbi:hypothetical protein R6Q59_022003 [Mikania micrantha]|uniref:Uncharacterized protein n=1 Tax=Mikania micrantha TaxID=192012 RepID=A0A5N6MVG1_9ASTR|nr:hypothetical protein E3N88_27000 [Mikania micrantha]
MIYSNGTRILFQTKSHHVEGAPICPLPVIPKPPFFYKPVPSIFNFIPHNSGTMDRNFAAGTIFTLLFAVSAARISLDPTPTDLPLVQTNCHVKSLPEYTTVDSTNLVVLPTETTKSASDAADQVQKSDVDRMFRVDLTPRSDYARFHAINRRFNEHRVPIRFDHPHPYRHLKNPFVIPRSEISHRNEVIVTSENGNFVARNLHRHGPSSRLKFKHDYGHHHSHQHHHMHHKSKDVSMLKHKFDRENVKSSIHQHKDKTMVHEASSFMKSIRKFLKHTFD